MFVRVKHVRNKATGKKYPYAYIVENSWKKGRVKQKVKKYLGRVHEFERQDEPFEEFVNCEIKQYLDKGYKDIVNDLVVWELMNHGFTKDVGGKGKNVYVNDKLKYDARSRKLTNHLGVDVAVAANDGLICTFKIKKLANIRPSEDEYQEEFGYRMAKEYVEAGIKVPEDVFVTLFEKVWLT